MYDLDQISSTIGDFINAVFHPSVANLPAGFLVLVFGSDHRRDAGGRAGKDAFGQPGGSRTDRQFVPNMASDLGDPALTTTAGGRVCLRMVGTTVRTDRSI